MVHNKSLDDWMLDIEKLRQTSQEIEEVFARMGRAATARELDQLSRELGVTISSWGREPLSRACGR